MICSAKITAHQKNSTSVLSALHKTHLLLQSSTKRFVINNPSHESQSAGCITALYLWAAKNTVSR